jgi:periplasmic copper chaperone A
MAKATSGAVYMTVRNAGAEPDTLTGISTDAAATAMLHKTVIEDGVAKMTMSHDIVIPAGGALELSPNGSHIMLEGLKAPLKQGGTMTLTLTFEKAGDVMVKVPIGAVAAMAP